MALLFQEVKDGIQLGKESDKCFVCNKEAYSRRETIQDGLLTNKEVFLLNLNGLRHCLCMDHFKTILGDYALMSKAEYEEAKEIKAQYEAMFVYKDINDDFDFGMEESKTKVEEKEGENKKSAKTTKAAKSSKGK